jgi:HMG box factor
LYREQNQAAVAAQNPGLTNSQISKIIAEQWRKLSQEAKDEWKALAEVCSLDFNLVSFVHLSSC